MPLPVTISSQIIQTIERNIKVLENTYGKLHKNSKTPQRVITPEDFAFGVYIGGLKSTMVNYAEETLTRKLTAEEWDEIDQIIIDYQDKIGKLIFR